MQGHDHMQGNDHMGRSVLKQPGADAKVDAEWHSTRGVAQQQNA